MKHVIPIRDTVTTCIPLELTLNLNLGGEVTLNVVPAASPPKDNIHGRFTFRFGQASITGDSPMDVTLPDDTPVEVQVTWVDSHGLAATVDGATTWTSGDTALYTVTVSPTDSTIATLTAVTPPRLGSAQLTAGVDADIGAGVEPITALGNVTVIAGKAVAGTIAVVPPTPVVPPA